MSGCVYLVGAGPGDAGLLTLRGRQVLEKAEAVVYDHLASPRLLDLAPSTAERIYVGKQAGEHTMKQEDISALLVRLAVEGKQVVRLKGGDPFVFGRGGEEALALAEAGADFEVVPGVTAGVAAPAYAGIPVTHRGAAGAVAFVTGHEAGEENSLDYSALARFPGTLVFFMGAANIEAICRRLTEAGLDPRTPAAVIRWGSTPRQQTVAGTAEDLAARALAAGIESPALIVLGKVVALRDKLNWFESRPLLGRRIVVTRSRGQASELVQRLEALGAEAVELPMIRIEPPLDPAPLHEAVTNLDRYDWVVFTSTNAVDAFFAALRRAGRDSRALAGVKLCVVGPATAERLSDFGLAPDAMPERYEAAAVVDALAAKSNLLRLRVLHPTSDLAGHELADLLRSKAAAVGEIVAYRTVAEAGSAAQAAAALAQGVHWITFTSSSTVTALLAVIPAAKIAGSHARLASIGPQTSAALRNAGLTPTVEADTHTIPGLVEAILDAERKAISSQLSAFSQKDAGSS